LAQKTPQYILEDIMSAAKVGNINMTPMSEKDSSELGYDLEEVQKCLLSLTTKDFYTVRDFDFKGRSVPCDVYQPSYAGPDGVIDELYIKFRYIPNWITILSFHLQRYG